MEDQANLTTCPPTHELFAQAVYPATASQFFALLEQRSAFQDWGIYTSRPRSEEWCVGFQPRYCEEVWVLYMPGRQPAVSLSAVGFELSDLFRAGAHWDHSLYPDNPYMPFPDKSFLDEVYFVVTGVRLPRVRPGGGREAPTA
jgi:hypothetical protein